MDRETLRRIYTQATQGMVPRREIRILHGDIPTFMEFPRADDPSALRQANVAVIGFPHEGFRPYNPVEAMPSGSAKAPSDSIYYRTGSEEAPAGIRRWSLQHSIRHYGGSGYFAEYDLCLSDHLRAVDCGDVECREGDTNGNVLRGRERVREIVRAGAIPLILGGDHAAAVAGILGVTDCLTERLGIIAFDAHFDLFGGGDDPSTDRLYASSSQYIQALETGRVEPENIVMIGMRGIHNPRQWAAVAKGLGIRYFTMWDVEEKGIERVIDEAIERACHGTRHLYVTLDIDAMDSLVCPGTRFPDTPGLAPREVLKALRTIGAARTIGGFDVSEVAPQYDPHGGTQLFAASTVLEVLGGIAAQFRANSLDRWYPSQAAD
jgi:agmatinase